MEQQLENSAPREWQIIGSPITRETGDLGLCDFTPSRFYLLKMTATSDAGATTVLYRVQTGVEIGGNYRHDVLMLLEILISYQSTGLGSKSSYVKPK